MSVSPTRFISKFWNKIYRFLCSLKLAVIVIVTLALSLAVGTTLESKYDTPTAQYWIYRSTWFFCLLGFLGLNIFFVALSRYPWKRRHTPFLLAHLGILMLLVGSWITFRVGLDGSMRITEGESQRVVEVDQPLLSFSDGKTIKSILIPWTPPHAKFKAIKIPEYGLTVDQFVAHVDAQIKFVEDASIHSAAATAHSSDQGQPAVRLKLQGGPMRITQEFWMWTGDPGWSRLQMGPARFLFTQKGATQDIEGPGPWLILTWDSGKKSLKYRSMGSDGKRTQGSLDFKVNAPQIINPGWKGDVKLTVLDVIPRATATTSYLPSKIEYGAGAPPSAIHIQAEGGKSQLWLGLGDRGVLTIGGKEIVMGYSNRNLMLPFGIRLNRFTVDTYPGSNSPSAYRSQVTVQEDRKAPFDHLISMNEPLDHAGITFYQASYENREPRPITSILSVNRDPGRWLKYWGSLLIVLGSILLFALKWKTKRQAP